MAAVRPERRGRERLLVAGGGMAGLKLIEELTELCPRRYEIVMVGKEPRPPCNRVLLSSSAKGQIPKGIDNFRWRFYGLFYVAPTQNSYMCRLRIPNGILSHWQLEGVADWVERYIGGDAHVTTSANLQIRNVMPEGAR